MDQLSDPAMGSSSGNAASFSNQDINGVGWKTILFTNASAGTEFARIRIEVERGQTLSSLSVITSAIPSGSTAFSDYEIDIYSSDFFGQQTLEGSFGPSPASIGGASNMASITFSGLSLVGSLTKLYWVEIRRNSLTGFNEDLHYIQYTLDVDTIEGISGVA